MLAASPGRHRCLGAAAGRGARWSPRGAWRTRAFGESASASASAREGKGRPAAPRDPAGPRGTGQAPGPSAAAPPPQGSLLFSSSALLCVSHGAKQKKRRKTLGRLFPEAQGARAPPSGRAGRGAGRARADRGGPGATGKESAQRGRSASHPPTPARARLARSPGHRGVGWASASPSLQVRLVWPALRLLPPPPAAVPPPPARPRSVALCRQRLGPPVLCGPRWSRPASPLRQVPSEAAGSQVASSGAATRPASSRLPPSAGLQEPS